MLGKIFSESDNIYHDQAKVLLDYYSAAAEKIVAEEERIEEQIAILEEEKAMSLLVNGFISGVVKQLPLEYAGELNRLIELEMEGSVG